MKKVSYLCAGLVAAGVVLSYGATVFAQSASETELTQVINAGTLHTDIVDGSGSVTAPTVAMSITDTSVAEQTTTGQYGTSGERIYINNPGAADNGWNLTVAASGGPTALWQDGTKTFDYNDPGAAGQLTLDPSVSTITPVSPGTLTGITKGTSAAFVQGTTDAITLASAGASSGNVWEGSITGIGVSQKIPASQEPGQYKIKLTQTLTAQ